jgi:hypothetical protein
LSLDSGLFKPAIPGNVTPACFLLLFFSGPSAAVRPFALKTASARQSPHIFSVSGRPAGRVILLICQLPRPSAESDKIMHELTNFVITWKDINDNPLYLKNIYWHGICFISQAVEETSAFC